MWRPVQEAEERTEIDHLTILKRLDQLELGRWHIFVALALGMVWIFDGYEVTTLSLYRNQIEQEMSESTFKQLVTAYQLGGIVGSILFGISAFIIGRRKIFLVMTIYFVGVMLSGVKTGESLFIFSRFLTGLSVGGEFTAIFTAVDQFLPPQYRGRVNIAIDGTWHLGGALASCVTMLVGETEHWRLMFLFGWIGIVSLVLMRRNVPESPRWLILKNRKREADSIISAIEEAIKQHNFLINQIKEEVQIPTSNSDKTFLSYLCEIFKLLKQVLISHPSKFIVSFALIFCQAFFFSQVYYQYPTILAHNFAMSQADISKYMLPLSIVNFISTLLLGPFFDEVGRRVLILLTYGSSAILLVISYQIETFFWREAIVIVMFLFASPASSSANLIASEIFPTSSRTLVMFVMFIMSMLGGMSGVWVNNYLVSAVMMLFAGILAFILCPNSEKKTLEQIQQM